MTARTAFAAAALLAAGPAFAALDADHGPLVTPAELSAALEDGGLTVIDIRAPDGAGYAGGHVEGALNTPYGAFRGPEENPGQLPEIDALTETLQGLGLTGDSQVVVTYGGESVTDFGAAARVYWTLKSAGIEDLAILNGGIAAWDAAGLPLSTAGAEAEPSDFTVTWNDRWTATAETVQSVLDGDRDAVLLDARPESFWSGEEAHPAAARPGTLPQSQYFTHDNWFSSGPAIVDAEAARALAAEQDFADAESIISFCNTGHWAATNWFALSELAGVEDVKLYPESVVGWSNAGFEMANVPGALKNFWNQVKDTF
ncbi:sulfurtransferase [Palleronia sediminis]|uniref:Sulfurtransferase n=1 Tax=Palleronia sediminis TaxID=2547833 RepID=A0A4R6AA41_9RHOB|nr:rhodanese-like domain-containing protein [Palleronia sediminis]TDL79722.1 sulfurtransferase [Palleronia sediminis]